MSNPWVDSLIRVGTRLVSALKAGPPKNVFNPEYLTGNNFLKRFNEVKRAEGFGAAYNKTRMESTLRKGSFVGKDYNGNMYYEDKNAPYGRTRWVEYPTPKGIWAIEQNYDASMVRNQWPTRSCLKAQLARAWHETERVSCAARSHAGEPGVARLAALHARQAGQRAGALALPAPPLWCRASARTFRPSPTRHPRPIVGPETRRCSSPLRPSLRRRPSTRSPSRWPCPSTRACSGPNLVASPNSISRRARWPRGSCVARLGPSTSLGAAPSRPLTPRCATVSVRHRREAAAFPPFPPTPFPPNPLLFGPAPAPAPAPAAGAPAPATYCRKVLPPGAGGLYPAFMAHRTMHPSRQPRCLESCALR